MVEEREEQSLEPQRIDLTESLQPITPFNAKVREIVDREFPITPQQDPHGQVIERRNYSLLHEMLDTFARLNRVQAVDERRILGETSPAPRPISLLEASVGLTLLAGKEYARGGRTPEDWGSFYIPGDISVQMGNMMVGVYDSLRKRAFHMDLEYALKDVCAVVVGGMFGASKIKETFAAIGENDTFDFNRVKAATRKYLTQKETQGELLEGSTAWFDELMSFFQEISQTPFQRVLVKYAQFVKDPLSEEEVIKAVKAALKRDKAGWSSEHPKLIKMAQSLGIIQNSENTK